MALTVKELMEAIIQSLSDVDLESEVLVDVTEGMKIGFGRIVHVEERKGPVGLVDGQLVLVVE